MQIRAAYGLLRSSLHTVVVGDVSIPYAVLSDITLCLHSVLCCRLLLALSCRTGMRAASPTTLCRPLSAPTRSLTLQRL
jgi:hypothetical protein